jgi:hypothetical protein
MAGREIVSLKLVIEKKWGNLYLKLSQTAKKLRETD